MSVLALRNATLIPAPSDGAGRSPTLTLANGVVPRIEPDERFVPAPGVEEIDLAGAVVTAGFWNAHVHLIEPAWCRVRRAPAAGLQTALDDLFNRRGFTSAVDLGANPFETRVLQRRIESGELAGPRIRSSGTGLYPERRPHATANALRKGRAEGVLLGVAWVIPQPPGSAASPSSSHWNSETL